MKIKTETHPLIMEETFKQYQNALLLGKRLLCSHIVKELKSNNMKLKHLYDHLFKPSLYYIGELWEYNKISVAVEHMATSITESIMNTLYEDILPDIQNNRKVIVSSAENEYHQIGGKMVADIFELNGWDSYYLGANTPTLDLIRFAHDIQPDFIGISLTVYFHVPTLKMMIHTIQKSLINTPIIIGGQAFRHGSGQELANQFENVYFIDSLNSLESFIDSFDSNNDD